MSKLDKMSPKELALDLFKKGKRRPVIINILRKQFPNKSENALNIAMTRAAMKSEGVDYRTWNKDRKK
jgi:hypothetical protein